MPTKGAVYRRHLCCMDQTEQCVMTHRHTQHSSDMCRLDTIGGESNDPERSIQTDRSLSMGQEPFEAFRKHFCFAETVCTEPFVGFQIQLDRLALDGQIINNPHVGTMPLMGPVLTLRTSACF